MGHDGVLARRLALAATSLGFTVVQLDVSVVNVAIEPIRGDLGGSVSGVQWVVNAYTVVFAAFILSAGALGDRVGAKRVFATGFGVFTLASLACGLAPSLGALIGFRAVQGLGAALLVPTSLSVLHHAYPEPRERSRAVGIWLAGASLGLSGGPLVSGLLIAALDWRWIFFINLPLGLLGIVLTLQFAGETTRSTDRPLDPLGQVLAVLALAGLAGALIEGGRVGFAAPLVVVGYAVAAAAAAGFVVAEHRRRRPMLPLGLFGSRTFSSTTAMGLFANTAFYGLIFVLSLYFQTARGYDALHTGLAFLPATVAILVANLVTGRIEQRLGTRAVIVSAALGLAAGFGWLLVADSGTAYGVLIAPLALVGYSLGAVVPAITSAMLGTVPPDRSGVASGTLNTARQSGSVLGVALFGSFAAAGVVGGLHTSLYVGLGLGLVVAALGLLVSTGDEDPADPAR